VMNADGTGGHNISSALDRDVNGALIWARDGSGIYASPEDRGTANIVFIPVSGAAVTPVTKGNHFLRLSSMSGAGVMAGVRSTFQNPGDVVRVTLDPAKRTGQFTEVTAVNEDLLQGKRLATAEEVWYPSSGGARVQGWIVKPPSFNPNRKYPLLLEIHGGPHGMYNVGFDYMWQTWAASDVVVLYTNPRGSTGYGTAFGNAIDQAYPSVDYDDLMAGVDTVIGRGYIDDKQLYVAGCSGGGVLTSWIIGHTKRFTAAAVRCPVTDWISFSGHTDVPLFTRNFFDKPFWESPDQWLKQSPLMYVGNVTTPTMLMTGVLDMRTPMPQSEEYYTALKMRGVPTALLRFEGEWHGTESVPSNWIRTQLYMMRWFKKFTKPTS
ncbi:MAG: prolyl oligopeptidase family serine peptidase, partial [Gemmatimonadota bacterium]